MIKLLVDGSNAWYRAYSVGIAYMEAPGGPVKIMTYMLRKLVQKYGKDNVIVCWDSGKSGRLDLDPEYKGKRKAVSGVWEDIVYMHKMLECIGVCSAYKEGYEADDAIGSLATKFLDSSLIYSFDKDFYQLVNDRINVLKPEKTIKGKVFPEQIIDYSSVIEELGCTPNKVVILKSFRGDTSDNIPKLPIRFTSIFTETFFKVLSLSNSVEDFYSKINFFEDKYKNLLLEFKDRALLNEKLVSIKTGLDVKINKPKPDADAFDLLCQELKITKMRFSDWENISDEGAPPAPLQGSLF